ncbi:rab-GTPase-TBC domain-containing protein [Jimgerdemannia flammicorona]|uniref:Rab-GTPase-TBC domain-containing protein n=1 Tax=Jimgerdemannia flammicorona TaxID=994334 RepID=A0A433DC85_9FUNG|nr:rab-GTPase-TBC domain-containing protein [Jimgerdemannia flammicorona]
MQVLKSRSLTILLGQDQTNESRPVLYDRERYPQYLSPETVYNWNDHRSIPKVGADIWSLGIVLLELYLGNPFWRSPDIGFIFDSLLTLLRWQSEGSAGLFIEPADIWKHKAISTLSVSERALRFLHGARDGEAEQEDNDTVQFRSFVKSCLEVDVARRPSSEQLLSHPFFTRFVVDEEFDSWALKPHLRSDAIDITDEEFQETLNGTAFVTVSDNGTLDDIPAAPPKPTRPDPLQGLPLSQIYHFWKLAGGDVESDLVKRGILLSTPVIERLPRVVKVADGKEEGGSKRDTAYLYSDATSMLSFKELYQRLGEAKRPERNSPFEWDTDYFSPQSTQSRPQTPRSQTPRPQTPLPPVTPTTPITPTSGTPPTATAQFTHTLRHSNSSPSLSMGAASSPSSVNPPTATAPKLPLLIREKDVAYQFHRVTLFSELLRQYPASAREIKHHARVDVPPLLRGKVWAAVLDVMGDVEEEYNNIDKETETPMDRQVHIPRCHQYNQLLASAVGHEKLRRLLKCWVAANSNLVYWQGSCLQLIPRGGLDYLCAPFLTLNFNNEALAFACLQRFIPRFLCNFFLHDNEGVLQEYLAIFRHLLSFHDPELSRHVEAISFVSNLYAIPWFLTLFTHVFPLDKIYHLWDKFLVGPSSFPLFAGISILRQLRDTLLASEFNECILLFSPESFPEVDIEKCIQSALSMCKITPPSITYRVHDPGALGGPDNWHAENGAGQLWWERPIPLEDKKAELAPRISIADFIRLQPYALVLDIRGEPEEISNISDYRFPVLAIPPTRFSRGHLPSSFSVQLVQLSTFGSILKRLNKKYHIVLANRDDTGPQVRLCIPVRHVRHFAAELVNIGFLRTALLHGGFDAIRTAEHREPASCPICTCRPIKQTTANFKGKTEPPYVIWRCKNPIASGNGGVVKLAPAPPASKSSKR